jgi:hypothetical protein
LYDRIVKKCPVCEKDFETIVNHRNEKTTCSYSCSNTFFRSGENNPNWGSYGDNQERNGYRRIGFNFHKKECVVCGENKIVAIHHFDENLSLICFSFKSACIVCLMFVYQEPSRLFLQFFPAFQPPQTNASAPLPSQEDPSHCAEHLSPSAKPVQLASEPQIT